MNESYFSIKKDSYSKGKPLKNLIEIISRFKWIYKHLYFDSQDT